MKMTYDEARQYIKEASKAGIRPGLPACGNYAGVWEIRRMT